MATKKTSFVSLLPAICRGVDVFVTLPKAPPRQAMGHLLILSAICALVFSFARSFRVKEDVNDVCAFLQQAFGGVSVEAKGIRPRLKPDEPRVVAYKSTIIDYRPDSALRDLNVSRYQANYAAQGFLWTPRSVVGWNHVGRNNYFAYRAVMSKRSARWFDKDITEEKIVPFALEEAVSPTSFLSLVLFLPTGDVLPIPTLLAVVHDVRDFRDMADYVAAYTLLRMFVCYIAKVFINALFYSALFAFVFSLAGRSAAHADFASRFTLTLYAGFPGVIIATLLTAGDVPFLDYQTIYLIVLVIYLIMISKKFKRLSGEDDDLSSDFDD